MKQLKNIKTLFYSFCTLAIILSFFPGCNTASIHFADKKKYLSNSRRIGYQKQDFSKQTVVKYNFTSENTMKDFKVVNGKWQIKNGKLWAVNGAGNRSILLVHNLQTPLLIEFDATNYANPDGSIGDITILINAENSKDFFKTGYALTTGSFFNNCTAFYKLGKAIAKTEYSPLVSGKTYRVKIELTGGHIRYWLDDKIILELWDTKPLILNPKLWIGVRTWDTKMVIDNFTVYQGIKTKL